MVFGESLAYPFKGGNIPKVLIVILSFLVLVSSIVVLAMLMRSNDGSARVALTIFPILIGYGLFVSGYSISVIRSVLDGDELLPPIQLGRDLLRGLMVMLAGMVYAIPFIIVFFCIFAVAGVGLSSIVSSSSFPSSQSINMDGNAAWIVCGAFLLMLFMGFTIGFSFIVGMVRYAAEDTASALLDFGRNFGMVTSNLGTAFGLFFRQIALGIVYAIIIGIFNALTTGFLLRLVNDPNPSVPVLIGGLIAFYIVLLSLNLMSQLSSAHLFAGFGRDLGIGGGKVKHDDYKF